MRKNELKFEEGKEYTLRELTNMYNTIQKEMKELRIKFQKLTINDSKLVEHFKNDNPKDRFSNIMIAGTILGGIDLRNLQRESNNLIGEFEEYPYNKEQIDIIDRYYYLQKTLDKIETYVEFNCLEDEEEFE